jgi:hypothetical protein
MPQLGKNMRHALDFATRYPGWHSFAKDHPTRAAIKRLAERRLVEVNAFDQYRLASAEAQQGTKQVG